MRFRLATPSISRPWERVSPVCRATLKTSLVTTFCRRRSNRATVSEASTPDGWYLMPTSYCLLVTGSNCLPLESSWFTGSKDSV
ncbi:hypothetical protein D9M69_613890 [compost metagenome]